MTTSRHWTPEELQAVTTRYATERTELIAADLGRTIRQVYGKAHQLGLQKSAAYYAAGNGGRLVGIVGDKTRFKPGQTPWNKGTHFVAGGRSAETRFKKGRPASEARNYVPVGSLRISADGILERKITDDPSLYPARRWVAVHRLVWIEANGPVPAGHIVVFKPGQRTTEADKITLDRVECISLAENMRRNTFHNYGPEVARVVQLRGAITRQINKRERKKAA